MQLCQNSYKYTYIEFSLLVVRKCQSDLSMTRGLPMEPERNKLNNSWKLYFNFVWIFIHVAVFLVFVFSFLFVFYNQKYTSIQWLNILLFFMYILIVLCMYMIKLIWWNIMYLSQKYTVLFRRQIYNHKSCMHLG